MTPPRTAEEPDTLSPADRLRAHAMADRVIEIIEERHGISFHAMAEATKQQHADAARRDKIVQGAALTLLAAIIAAAFSLAGKIVSAALAQLGKG
jgi:hypothetical protein